jgi:hypothetical protein
MLFIYFYFGSLLEYFIKVTFDVLHHDEDVSEFGKINLFDFFFLAAYLSGVRYQRINARAV